MGVLQNFQWEKFSREFVELALAGVKRPAEKAYERAGYLPNPANGRRLSNRPEVRGRIQELVAEALEYANVRPARIVVEIDRVGRANLADFFEADGVTLRNIKELPREISAALASIEWGDDGKPKLKLCDKNQANFTLLKYLGGLPEPERRELNIFNFLSIDDQRTLAELLESSVEIEPGRPAPAGAEAQGERR